MAPHYGLAIERVELQQHSVTSIALQFVCQWFRHNDVGRFSETLVLFDVLNDLTLISKDCWQVACVLARQVQQPFPAVRQRPNIADGQRHRRKSRTQPFIGGDPLRFKCRKGIQFLGSHLGGLKILADSVHLLLLRLQRRRQSLGFLQPLGCQFGLLLAALSRFGRLGLQCGFFFQGSRQAGLIVLNRSQRLLQLLLSLLSLLPTFRQVGLRLLQRDQRRLRVPPTGNTGTDTDQKNGRQREHQPSHQRVSSCPQLDFAQDAGWLSGDRTVFTKGF